MYEKGGAKSRRTANRGGQRSSFGRGRDGERSRSFSDRPRTEGRKSYGRGASFEASDRPERRFGDKEGRFGDKVRRFGDRDRRFKKDFSSGRGTERGGERGTKRWSEGREMEGRKPSRQYEHRQPSWARGEESAAPRAKQWGGRSQSTERPQVEAERFERRRQLTDRDQRYFQQRDGKWVAQTEMPIEELREDRLEGRNPIREALRAGRAIDKLWVQKNAEGRIDPILYPIVKDAQAQGAVIMEVDRLALDKMSQTHAHQGLIAQTAMHEYADLESILKALKEKGEAPFILLLDEIKDAYNLGGIMRIAEAAGVHAVVIPKRRAVGLDAVVAKASAGAIEHVPCCRFQNLRLAIDLLKANGCWVLGTSLEASQSHTATDLTGGLALVIGSEGDGMRQSIAEQCDLLIKIPMVGQLNSLNAAVATGVVAFEALRQRLQKAEENA